MPRASEQTQGLRAVLNVSQMPQMRSVTPVDDLDAFVCKAELSMKMEQALEVKDEETLEKLEREWERKKKPAAQLKVALREATAAVGKTMSKREAVLEQERKAMEKKRVLAEKDRQKEEAKARKKLTVSGSAGHIWEHDQSKFKVVSPVSVADRSDMPVFGQASEELNAPLLIRGSQDFQVLLGLSAASAGSGAAAEDSKVQHTNKSAVVKSLET